MRRRRGARACAGTKAMSKFGAAVVVLEALVGAKVGDAGALAPSAPFERCDALARRASTVALITRHGTSPGKSLAVMPDANLWPILAGRDGSRERRGAPASGFFHIAQSPAAAVALEAGPVCISGELP
eukprot:1932546-Pyramimonas_sp.AAC.1